MVRILGAALAALTLAQPAFAQDAQPLPDPADNSDYWQLAAGVGLTPDYEGSSDYRLIPAAALRARVSGIEISTNATYLYVDVIPSGDKVDLLLGPIAGVRLNRTGKIKDDVVKLLPDRKTAIEVGGFAGVAFRGLTNPYDSLSVRLDVVKDVGEAHRSTVVTPNLIFATPLSRRFFASASLSADFVGNRYADYYFSISPTDALASGLAPYDADGGMKNIKIGLLGNYALSGDLTKGWSIFGIASLARLRGDFKRSPMVSDRGSATQWFAASGLAYTF
ncbi:MipA/OmpV family protein [Sphingomonas xanthus]|uniref:MipA/OmpV family protein n=1 Tax=Sphingomonas xanthus TaxID=2594473 RepID=A0A516IRE1_9SPHN|nr:MipA/OmpV family protein [Sphingomonas xanthus]QDP19486.1 MipA/OmpV family protein [Sphingomonas xanthus]